CRMSWPCGKCRVMEKRLSVVGNSLALVIEKPIRKLLGISRDTRLRVVTDGQRIIIEPIRPSAERARLEQIPSGHGRPLAERRRAGLLMFEELVNFGALPARRFTCMSEGLGSYGFRERLTGRHDIEDSEVPKIARVLDRMEICLGVLRATNSWEQTHEAAFK